eukprot:30920-Pelagococcus_subviridis.AAC.19
MSGNERGGDALRLEVVAHERVEQSRGGVRRLALRSESLTRVLEVSVRLVRLERHRNLNVQRLLQVRHHAEPLERRREVDLHRGLVRAVRVIHHLVRPLQSQHHPGHEVLGHLHEVFVIRVRHVKLARRELRVVRHVDALVPELSPDLVHAVHPADDELLQEQLRGDAHVQRHVEVVVVRDERLGGGAAGDHVHHRRLHLDEILIVEVLADASDDVRARDEDVSHLRVHDEVEEALPVPRLLILQAAEPGEHVQTRREHLEVAREDGQLAAFALARVAANADDIAAARGHVYLLEVVLRRHLRVRHDLDFHAVAAEVVKVQLRPGRSLGHETSRDGDLHALVHDAVRDAAEARDEVRERRVDVELVRVRVLAVRLARQDFVDAVRGVLRRVELALLVLLGLFGVGARRRGRLRRLRGVLLSLRLGVLRRLEALLVLAVVGRAREESVVVRGGVRGGRRVGEDGEGRARWRAIDRFETRATIDRDRSARGGGSHLLLMGSPGNSGYSLSAGASVWAGSAIVSACVVRRWGVACVRRRVRSPRRRRENPAV